MTNLEQKVRAARDMISALCKRRDDPGKREWIMSIPPRFDRDPDLVIAAALDAQAAEIARLRAALDFYAEEHTDEGEHARAALLGI